MSLCAAAVIWAGCVWSSWTNSFNGWPLTPPLSLTQLKYAWIMFGPSVKSVPGWCVSMVPMLIGEPVALTPGLGPHDEKEALAPPPVVPVLPPVVPVLALVLPAGALDVAALVAPPPELELLLLLPHPANASSATAATDASPIRIRGMR